MPARRPSAYSSLVRWLKIGLPLAALALLAAIFLIPRDGAFRGEPLPQEMEIALINEGLTVTNPSFRGATSAGEPFRVDAARAIPDKPDPELVRLETISARIDMLDGRRVELLSDHGSLAPKTQRLTLSGGVRVTTSDGYVVTTESAEADVKAGTLRAPGRVEATGPQGGVTAGSFRAERPADGEGPEILWFENRVKVVFRPSQGD